MGIINKSNDIYRIKRHQMPLRNISCKVKPVTKNHQWNNVHHASTETVKVMYQCRCKCYRYRGELGAVV